MNDKRARIRSVVTWLGLICLMLGVVSPLATSAQDAATREVPSSVAQEATQKGRASSEEAKSDTKATAERRIHAFQNGDGDTEILIPVPTFTEATCDAAPTFTPPVDTEFVTYEYWGDFTDEGDVNAGGEVFVFATFQYDDTGDHDYVWSEQMDPSWWLNWPVAHWSHEFANPSCHLPAMPLFTDATCSADPTFSPPVDDDVITYKWDGDVRPGGTVWVTAHLPVVEEETPQYPWGFMSGDLPFFKQSFSPDSYQWSDEIYSTDWQVLDPQTAEWAFTFADPDCPVVPESPVYTDTTCVELPTFTPPESNDIIIYEWSGDVEPGGIVVVTATLLNDNNDDSPQPDDGSDDSPQPDFLRRDAAINSLFPRSGSLARYVWGPDVDPAWSIDGDTATWRFTFADPNCQTPELPIVTDSVCVDRKATTPTLIVPENTDIITYEWGGDVIPGGTVWVTAILPEPEVDEPNPPEPFMSRNSLFSRMMQSGTSTQYVWDPIIEPIWVIDGLTATWTYTFPDPDCTESVAPELPTVVDSVCVDARATLPTITLPANTGAIGYSLTGYVIPGGTVTVTATIVGSGYVWSPDIDPAWSINGTSATWSYTFADPDCSEPVVNTPVVPKLPTVADSVCVDARATLPTVMLPANTADVSYTVTGYLVPGGTVTVTATLVGPTAVWGEVDPVWTITGTTATWTLTFADPDCEIVTPTPTEPVATETPTEPVVTETPTAPAPTSTVPPVGELPSTGAGGNLSSVTLMLGVLSGGLMFALGAWYTARRDKLS